MTGESGVNVPGFWQEVYLGGRAGWDLGGPTPALRRHLLAGRFPPGRLIALGAGRGHDAHEFARHGFAVTAVDFAAEAVRGMRALADPAAPVDIVQTDLFSLPPTFAGRFDYVFEYTCFCAIDPARRGEYADLVARLLKPGGTYIDFAFPLDGHVGGPPFAVSLREIFGLFEARGFVLQWREAPPDSVPQRRGIEEFLVFRGP